MTDQQTSGADIARQALAKARAAAKASRSEPPTAQRRRLVNTRITSSREPVSLVGAIGGLLETQGWDLNAVGGDLVADWPVIAPELADVVTAEHFDAAAGVLHLRPSSPAYATQLRLLQRQIVDRINLKVGRSVVRALRVLPPGDRLAADRRKQDLGTAVPVAAPGRPNTPHPEAAQALAQWRAEQAQARAAHDVEQVRRTEAVRARLRPYGPDLRESETDSVWIRTRDCDAPVDARPHRGTGLRESEDNPGWQSVLNQQPIDPADSLDRHQAAAAVARAHRSCPRPGDPAPLFRTRVA